MGVLFLNNNSEHNNNKRFFQTSFLIALGALLFAGFILMQILDFNPSKNRLYSEIVAYFRKEEVVEYKLDLGSGSMEIKLKSGEVVKYIVPSARWMREDIKEYIKNYNEKNPDDLIKENVIRPQETPWFFTILLNFLPGLLLMTLMFFLMRKLSGSIGEGLGGHMGFMKSKFKNAFQDKGNATFEDVAGSEEEKEELAEIVEFLKYPRKYNDMGAVIPKGILLVGSPGTGKTLLARAVSGEAKVPFLSISGSEFVEMYVGLGASRVRDLFEQAKKNSPCIIFIDELDAVGRKRSSGGDKGNDEREQTLNQLLVEMDGFGINEGIIVMAATNRGDVLDKALLRPGRFDRQIVVSAPDVKDREAILKVHAKGKPLAPDVVLKTIARSTAGLTGADLKNILNEAALLTVREELKSITMKQIQQATMKVIMGIEKKSRIIHDEDKKITAYHEAGHAVANYYCKNHDPVHEISIIPRGTATGYTLSLPEEDKSHLTKKQMFEQAIVLYGGRIAEAIVIGDVSTGASHDIAVASELVKSMVTKYGMSEIVGPIAYEDYNNEQQPILLNKNFSEKVAEDIDSEVKKIVSSAYRKSESILRKNLEKLHQIAKFLIEHEKMNSEEFNKIMAEKS